MSKIRVIVDSAGDLPLDVAQKENVLVLPIKYSFDGENQIRDKYDMSDEEFYKKLRDTGAIPKTTQITPLEFEEAFREQAKDYDELIVITIGAKASGTYQNAVNIANMIMEDTSVKIHVVDSKSLSYNYGYMAYRAQKLINEGASSDDALKLLDKLISGNKTFFTVETLDNLKKGGRITTMSAIIGGMLDIKPIIEIKDGLTSAIDKVKGEKKAILKMVELIKNEALGKENAIVHVIHTDVPDKAELIKQMLEEQGVKVEGIGKAGPVIGCHSGPGAFGISVMFE